MVAIEQKCAAINRRADIYTATIRYSDYFEKQVITVTPNMSGPSFDIAALDQCTKVVRLGVRFTVHRLPSSTTIDDLLIFVKNYKGD